MFKEILFKAIGLLLIVTGWEILRLDSDDLSVCALQYMSYLILCIAGICFVEHSKGG